MAMITESRFTTGIIKCEPRRRWGRKVLFFVAALLVCWLLSGCQMHGEAPPWLRGAVLGLCTFGLVGVLWKVALWVKRRDDEALARWAAVEPQGEECGEVNTPFDAFGLEPWEDIPNVIIPLLVRCQGIDAGDVGRIVNALLINCCEAEDLLRKSAKPNPCRAAGPVYCRSCGVLAALMPGPDARQSEAMKRVQGIKSGLSGLARMFPLPLAESRSEFGGLPRA